MNSLSVITVMSDNREDIANVGLDTVAFGEPEGEELRMVVETFNLLIAEWHDKNKGSRYMI